MCVCKRGKYFHYDFIVASTRYRGSTKQTTKARAQKFEALLMADARDGRLSNTKITRLADFSKRFLKWVKECRLDDDTKRYYRNGWRMLEQTKLAGMKLNGIANDDVEALGPLEHSAYNINCARRTLRRMLSKAVEWKMLRVAPKISLEEEHGRAKTFSIEQQQDYLTRCPQPLLDVSMLIFDTGMRPEEVYRMRWENIDYAERRIFVPFGKTKNSRRFVPLSLRCESALMVRKAEQDKTKLKGSPWVFASKRSVSGHLSPLPCSRQFSAVRTAMGLSNDYVLYTARHTFGTEVMEKTGNPKLVMKVMGHGDLKTTARYVHPETDMVREMVDKRNSEVTTIVTTTARLQ